MLIHGLEAVQDVTCSGQRCTIESIPLAPDHPLAPIIQSPANTLEVSPFALTSFALTFLRRAISSAPTGPGVYRFQDESSKDLYIGKAKNIQKRLMSYTHVHRLSPRLQRMLLQAQNVAFVTTQNELEALLLEAQLIKKHQPLYNILLKDGHYFSYIALSQHPYPRAYLQRQNSGPESYFGPFLSTSQPKNILEFLWGHFGLRSCSDSFFAKRKRPCLQYYIEKCTAPCAGKICAQDYEARVEGARQVLSGNTRNLQKHLYEKMEALSHNQAYQSAAKVRDQWRALEKLAPTQTSSVLKSADIVVFSWAYGMACAHISCWRFGTLYGAESLFFPHVMPQDQAEALFSLVDTFYATQGPGHHIVLQEVTENISDIKLLLKHRFGKAPHMVFPRRGPLKKLLLDALQQAENALNRYRNSEKEQASLWRDVQKVLDLPALPRRIEIYDNSHHGGKSGVAAMVVADTHGFVKRECRAFSMESLPQGHDDYEMMRRVMARRFSARHSQGRPMPDIVVIDGGMGQLGAALSGIPQGTFPENSTPNKTASMRPLFFAICKTEPHDSIYGADGALLPLDPNGPYKHVFYLFQRWRDEAHRFALASHKRAQKKAWLDRDSAPKKPKEVKEPRRKTLSPSTQED